MTVTAAMLANRAKVKGGADNPEVGTALTTAEALVTEALAGAFREPADAVRDEMVLSVGFAMLDRTKSSDGTRQQITMDSGSTPVRAPRDPLASIRTLLANYVGGFA